jgi:hypothetical protein
LRARGQRLFQLVHDKLVLLRREEVLMAKGFNPGGTPGKLHRELGIPVGQKIPAKRLQAATHSRDAEIRRDAIRAKTMKGWHHGGSKTAAER